jgi:L,D-transpeptidase ErfK/SrfK
MIFDRVSAMNTNVPYSLIFPPGSCAEAPTVRPARLAVILLVCAWMAGCAIGPKTRELPPPAPQAPPVSVEKHVFDVPETATIVGEVASVEIREGDTLPDIARHYGLGFQEIADANPEVDPWVPHGNRVLLPLQFTLPEAPRTGVTLNLAAYRLFYFPPEAKGGKVLTYPVGIGKEGRSTPMGLMSVVRKAEFPTWYPTENIRRDHARKGDPLPAAVPPGPDNPLGDYALYLSQSRYLVHGTNKPYSIGLRASNGCIRLYPEDISVLFPQIPRGTPVRIVNQPYLIGRRDGQVFLEVHRPFEELDPGRLRHELYGRLKRIEKKEQVALDWQRVETILAEARGIPLPIADPGPAQAEVVAPAKVVPRPRSWFGQPPVLPEREEKHTQEGSAGEGQDEGKEQSPQPPAWFVQVAEMESAVPAKKLAAILRHQGPPIPARAVPTHRGYEILAGPFRDATEAEAVARRIRIDLELDAKVRTPREASKPKVRLRNVAAPSAAPA